MCAHLTTNIGNVRTVSTTNAMNTSVKANNLSITASVCSTTSMLENQLSTYCHTNIILQSLIKMRSLLIILISKTCKQAELALWNISEAWVSLQRNLWEIVGKRQHKFHATNLKQNCFRVFLQIVRRKWLKLW